MIKLGTVVQDSFTGATGMLVLCQIDSNNGELYFFQPKGLNPKNGQPIDAQWITKDRIKNGVEDKSVDIPFSVLGTFAEDKASGFKGIIAALTIHLNGCVHAVIQPKGVIKETGAKIDEVSFDIRRLQGKQIKALNDEELEISKKKNPSPISFKKFTPTT